MAKILVISAHLDDEVIGLGGTIVKHIEEGDEVYLSVLTDSAGTETSEKKRLEEIAKRKKSYSKVSKLFGIKDVIFHDLPDGKLDTFPQLEINKIIESDIKIINPQRIYTHSKSDIHADHRVVFNSVLVATRKQVPEVFCYETVGCSNKMCKFDPNYYVDISKQIGKKLKAMGFYKSVLQDFPRNLSVKSLKTLTEYRGIESELHNAEAFECIKFIKC